MTLSILSLIVASAALGVALMRNRWMAKQLQLSSSIPIINWLEEVRDDRHVLYKVRDEQRSYQDWTPEEHAAANRITRRMDILGLIDTLGYVDKRLVERFYGIPVAEIWDICQDWVREEQARRGPQHLYEFQKLAERVKAAGQQHPARSQATSLPPSA